MIRTEGTPLLRVKRADLDAAGVHRVESRTTGAVDGRPRLDDGTVLEVANVIWCTGFRQEFSVIHPPVTGEDGWPRDEGGIVPSSPGLYLHGPAVPARLLLDVDRRHRAGRELHRPAPRHACPFHCVRIGPGRQRREVSGPGRS